MRGVDAGHEDVLDVHHADHVIEAFAIDRKAAVAGIGEGLDQILEADVRRDGHDIAARDGDFARGLLAEMQHVAKHLALYRREIAGDGPRILGLVDRLFDLLAQCRLAVLAEDQVTHAAPKPRSALFVAARRHYAASSYGLAMPRRRRARISRLSMSAASSSR